MKKHTKVGNLRYLLNYIIRWLDSEYVYINLPNHEKMAIDFPWYKHNPFEKNPQQKTIPTRKSSLSSPRTHAIWRIFFSYSETLGKPCAFAPHLIGPSRNWIRKYQPRFTPRKELIGSCSAKYGGVIQADPKKKSSSRKDGGSNRNRITFDQDLPIGGAVLKP